jgi:hypothetical protein
MAFRGVPKGRGARLWLATTVACFAATGVANAACTATDLSQPFTQFGDNAFYTLVPDGSFEAGGAGWTLNGNSTTNDNEKYYANKAEDARSLRVKPNAPVVSPVFCVDQDMPSLRLFGKKVNAAKSGHLRVDVLYNDASGNPKVANAGSLDAGPKQEFADWRPSGLLKLNTALPMSRRGTASVQVRFTADSGGEWSVDDVFADPRLRR